MPRALADFTDDDVLVPALRLGDEEAFGWLLDRYSAPLLHLARIYVSNPEASPSTTSRNFRSRHATN